MGSVLAFFSLFMLPSCATLAQNAAVTPFTAGDFVIWAHSDIQPRTPQEKRHYETAIADVRANLPPIDLAIVAGDIVQRHRCADDYAWFLHTRSRARVPYWFEIAGNHDARNFAAYFEHIRKPLYYSVNVGNLLMIFLSDEVNSSPSEISDTTFRWWRKLVVENQDKIIITVTHAYLAQSKLFGHFLYRSNILGSNRFARVLKKHRVDIWLAGHTTAPDHFGRSEHLVEELGGTLFVNVSSVRHDFGMDTKSRFLVFRQGSPVVSVKLRNHDAHAFVDDREIRLCLEHRFEHDGKPPRMSLPDGTIAPGPLSPAR